MSSSPFSSPGSRPRLSCRWVRAWCSVSGGTAPGHASHCADCQEYFAACNTLDATLRRHAAVSRDPGDDDLERRILRAVRASTASAVSPARRTWSPVWPVAIGAATVALVIGFVIRGSGEINSPSNTTADAQALANTVKSLSSGFVETVIPSAGARVANNPMQTELDSIYSDARAALGFLALNFLPASSEISPSKPRRTI